MEASRRTETTEATKQGLYRSSLTETETVRAAPVRVYISPCVCSCGHWLGVSVYLLTLGTGMFLKLFPAPRILLFSYLFALF